MFFVIILQVKPSHKMSPLPWLKQVEREDEEEEEEEEKKCFSSPFPSPPASSPIRRTPPSPVRPPAPANGERRGRGRPPKNWPWGKGRPGRPRKHPPEEENYNDDRAKNQKAPGVSSSLPPGLFGPSGDGNSGLSRPTELPRLPPAPAPRSRGRPPRKKRGPKPRLSEGPGDTLPLLPPIPRPCEPPPVHRSRFSESSDDEEEDDEEMQACSPPILTKPTLGLKCKVRGFEFVLQDV